MSLRVPLITILAGLAVLGAAPAGAQLLPSPSSVVERTGLPLPRLPLADRLASDVDGLADRLTPDALAAARLDRLTALVRAHPRALERDDQGQPVVRGEVLAVSPTPEALAKVVAAGFVVARQTRSDDLGLSLVTLTPPKGLSARAAIKRLRDLDPGGDYDFNHVYADAGLETVVAASAVAPAAAQDGGGRAGLLDGGVAADQPVFTHVRLEQRGFADGGARPSAHGTATASLLAAAGADQILVADVYGKGPAGGSASAIVGALAWMAQARAPVVNISLVGPPNGALGAAVKALLARGCLIVAAVGNDGPAAPALYPASYPGVIAVTGVDRRRRLLPEAGRAAHVDFAAYGAEVKVAAPGGRPASVRGTSYAAPVVAGRLARLLDAPDPAAAQRAVARLAAEAVDLGAPGVDPVFGNGLVEAAAK
ncbi:S8 family serine peptidase [Caulobacter sp. LjRoot300]|uniref:S8 family serine peptidase n=1 Tax=Caulobacter sp. LjRoot300 TaxID=3342321 RepID=UPI003ECE0FD2